MVQVNNSRRPCHILLLYPWCRYLFAKLSQWSSQGHVIFLFFCQEYFYIPTFLMTFDEKYEQILCENLYLACMAKNTSSLLILKFLQPVVWWGNIIQAFFQDLRYYLDITMQIYHWVLYLPFFRIEGWIWSKHYLFFFNWAFQLWERCVLMFLFHYWKNEIRRSHETWWLWLIWEDPIMMQW